MKQERLPKTIRWVSDSLFLQAIPNSSCVYRLEDSRSTPGSGLGLSLVKAVAKLHRASLLLEDNAPGLKATLRLR